MNFHTPDMCWDFWKRTELPLPHPHPLPLSWQSLSQCEWVLNKFCVLITKGLWVFVITCDGNAVFTSPPPPPPPHPPPIPLWSLALLRCMHLGLSVAWDGQRSVMVSGSEWKAVCLLRVFGFCSSAATSWRFFAQNWVRFLPVRRLSCICMKTCI